MKYRYKKRPYVHQVRALKKLLSTGWGGALLMEPRTGKGLRHGEKVLTPQGMSNIEDLSVGDFVMGSDGKPTPITGVFPQGLIPTYRVTFNDGSSLVVDENHLWSTRTHLHSMRNHPFRVMATKDLMAAPRFEKRRYEIPLAAPIKWPKRDLPIDPYTMGVLLGDGSLSKSAHFGTDPLTMAEVARRSKLGKITEVSPESGHCYATVLGAKDDLKAYGLLGKGSSEKFIPSDYLYASPKQRLALLQGLMDTDGSLSIRERQVSVHFGSTSETLRDQVVFLVQSLGGTATKTTKREPKYQNGVGRTYYRTAINLPRNPFLTRVGWEPRTRFRPKRIIRSIEYEGVAEVTCIKVAAQNELFVTQDCIVTHNTKVAIDYISILHQAGRANRVIVIGPLTALEVWKDQLAENCPFPVRLTIWDSKGRKAQNLPPYGHDILDIVLMNYDAFSTPGAYRVHRSGPNKGQPILDKAGNKLRSKSRGGRYDMKKQIRLWQPQVMVLDESHRIKSPSAKKSTALHSLASIPEYKLILTGTVVTKSKRLFDIYSQWKFLNPERFPDMNFNEFKHHFGRWVAKDRYEQWIKNINEDELHSKIHLDSFSITREECYDLPKQTTQIMPVKLEESAELYDRMAEDMVAKIHTGEITEASIRLVQRLRLQQITSGITKASPTQAYPQGRIVEIGAEKLRMITSRLEDLMEADEKVVIGALFKADIQRLVNVCTKHLKVPTFVIRGGMKPMDRNQAPKQFKAARGGAVFIGQPAAAGEAIDLSCASILQWYSLPSSWVNFRQFSDRIALSDKPTFHEFYLARGTVDFLLYETLLEDGDIGKKMITSPERLLRVNDSYRGGLTG